MGDRDRGAEAQDLRLNREQRENEGEQVPSTKLNLNTLLLCSLLLSSLVLLCRLSPLLAPLVLYSPVSVAISSYYSQQCTL
jgi:hypothetical protein